MSNRMYDKIHYIYWSKEAKKIKLSVDDMKAKIQEVQATRKKATSKTKRFDFMNEDSYAIDKHGDYYELYMKEDNEYRIYSTNAYDSHKNEDNRPFRADRAFESKFAELNGLTLRKAFGFVNKATKRCIPKQFYFINQKCLNKLFKASSIDASSQYPSGCYGKLPDAHTKQYFEGRVKPTAEYPFAFYSSGHIAIYGELDTHDWVSSRFFNYLFRFEQDEYCFQPKSDEEEVTVLCKASPYTMDATWDYFYNKKKSCAKDSAEYKDAKLVMNSTIGSWHRKDKDKKRIMTYDDHGSYQMAHIAAVCIARGNQKILNMIDKIGFLRILHVCVDGIVYTGDQKFGIDESKIGQFQQEFTGADFMMTGMNCYAAEIDGKPVKFKHGGYELMNGEPIDESIVYGIKDLANLSAKQKIGDIING